MLGPPQATGRRNDENKTGKLAAYPTSEWQAGDSTELAEVSLPYVQLRRLRRGAGMRPAWWMKRPLWPQQRMG
ncbi:MAG TPA: hypothetical protein VHX68_14795, partial [Planctomycetaceae bacterium]|nr:hypothetical protein [Planctomycetaceae bacterium]